MLGHAGTESRKHTGAGRQRDTGATGAGNHTGNLTGSSVKQVES